MSDFLIKRVPGSLNLRIKSQWWTLFESFIIYCQKWQTMRSLVFSYWSRFLIQGLSRLLLLMKVEESLRLDLRNFPNLLIINSSFIVIDRCSRTQHLIVTQFCSWFMLPYLIYLVKILVILSQYWLILMLAFIWCLN